MDCGRTLDEIARWAGLTDLERAAILADLPARLARRAEQRPDARRGVPSSQAAQQQQ